MSHHCRNMIYSMGNNSIVYYVGETVTDWLNHVTAERMQFSFWFRVVRLWLNTSHHLASYRYFGCLVFWRLGVHLLLRLFGGNDLQRAVIRPYGQCACTVSWIDKLPTSTFSLWYDVHALLGFLLDIFFHQCNKVSIIQHSLHHLRQVSGWRR